MKSMRSPPPNHKDLELDQRQMHRKALKPTNQQSAQMALVTVQTHGQPLIQFGLPHQIMIRSGLSKETFFSGRDQTGERFLNNQYNTVIKFRSKQRHVSCTNLFYV